MRGKKTTHLTNMELFVLYLSYLFVGFIHSFFIGIGVYTVFGKLISKKSILIQYLVLLSLLIFLEVYWKPIFNYLGINVTIKNKTLINYLQIDPNTNIVSILNVNIYFILSWLVQAFVSLKIGHWSYKQKMR